MTVTRRLLVPTLLGIVLAIGALVLINLSSQNSLIVQREDAQLGEAYATFYAMLSERAQLAQALATSVADMPAVQAAFAAQDRTTLLALVKPTYRELAQRYRVAQMQFHLPPATLFLRVDEPQRFGDDLSSIRHMVVQANIDKTPQAGLEVGRTGAGMRGIVPMAYQGQYIGSVEYGIGLDDLFLEQFKARTGADSAIYLTSKAMGIPLAPSTAYTRTAPVPELSLLATTGLDVGAAPNLFARALRGETVADRLEFNTKPYVVEVGPLYDYNGDVIGAIQINLPRGTVLDTMAASRNASLIWGGLISLLVMLAVWGLTSRTIIQPLRQLTQGVQRLEAGDRAARVQIVRRDELGQLGGAFNALADQIADLLTGLERRVEERTAELQTAAASLDRRAREIATAAEVARAATALLDPEQLITQVVQVIQERFGFYYTGLFLLDEENHYAVLRQGSGEAGRTMKERGHRLEVGSQSMVGWVCANKQARIALDVGDEPVRFANPLLPDTHSEMALPLRVGEHVLGALDVQSTQAAAFDESDIAVLQSMADQVAVTLENARLFQQTQTALKELEASNRLLVREGWQGYLQRPQAICRAEFRAAPLPPVTTGGTEPLTIPLELRGHPLGKLTLRREGERAWTDEELQMVQAIALQTALAADNARLMEQTQQALDETRALYETSREITSAAEMSQVLSAVLDNLSRTGIHAAAVALFDAPTREQAKHIELAGTWDYTGTPRLAPGARFEIASFPLFNRITDQGALVSSDLLADPEVDDVAKRVLGGLGLRAMAITPLVARGQWIGVLFAMVEHAHAFTPSELNFQRALADQTAIAIDSRRLLAETERRAEREQQIRQITNAIMSASRTEQALAAATDGLENLWNAALARIWLIERDEQGEALFLRASAGLSRRLDGTRRRVPLSEAYKIGRIAISGEPKFSTQLETDPEVIDHEWVRREGLRSFVGYPLKYGERVVGVLGMYSRELYSQTEFALMGTLVQQVSTVLENRRLFDDAQRRAERETLIRQITTRIRAAGDVQGVLEATATELAQSMRAPRAIVRLTMGDGKEADNRPASQLMQEERI